MIARLGLRDTLVAAVAVVLASTSLASVYATWGWVEAVALAVGAVVAAGLCARALALPALLHPVVGVLGLLLACTARFASSGALGGIVPTRASQTELGQQYRYGLHDVTTGGPPYPSTTGSLLLATVGVGLVALAVDLFVVGGRRPSLAGIPLLALVVIPAAAGGGGIGILAFLLASAGFLALLALEAEERARRWGRALAGMPGRTLATESAAGSAGWRIGAVALGAALLVPLTIPGADHSPFHGGGGSGGNSSTTVINPLVQVQTNLRESGTTPLLSIRMVTPTYQRLTALENFGEDGFTLRPLTAGSGAKVDRGLTAPDTGTGGANGTSVTETVTAANALAERFLPVPQSTTAVQVEGDWRLAQPTATIFSSRTDTRGKVWTAQATLPAPAVATLEAAGTPLQPSSPYGPDLALDLQVPIGLPGIVAQTARAWAAADGARTSYDIAVSLQRHFTDPGQFTYDLNASVGPGVEGFAQFLRDRRGYCQQFASTMVAMLRELGIPARVAIGFTAGQRQPDGLYLITNHNAHAWPEVWFATTGWIRFEPTPLSDGTAQVPPYALGTAPAPTGPSSAPAPTVAPSPTPATAAPSTSANNPKQNDAQTNAAASGNGHSGLPSTLLWVVGATLLALLAGTTPRLLQRWRRRRGWAGVARRGGAGEFAWSILLDDVADRGLTVSRASSPRRVARQIFDAIGTRRRDAGIALGDLVAAVEASRYAPASNVVAEPPKLETALAAVRRSFDASLPGRRRFQLTWFPPSALRLVGAPVRHGLRWSSGLVDTAVGLLVRARRTLPGGSP